MMPDLAMYPDGTAPNAGESPKCANCGRELSLDYMIVQLTKYDLLTDSTVKQEFKFNPPNYFGGLGLYGSDYNKILKKMVYKALYQGAFKAEPPKTAQEVKINYSRQDFNYVIFDEIYELPKNHIPKEQTERKETGPPPKKLPYHIQLKLDHEKKKWRK